MLVRTIPFKMEQNARLCQKLVLEEEWTKDITELPT